MVDIIPTQTQGGEKDNVAVVDLPELKQAREHYTLARARLLDINHWGNMSGFLSASFSLIGPDGKQVKNRLPKIGDYFRIKVPAPAPLDEYDWVRVELIEEVDDGDRQMTAIRVRPASDPGRQTGETQHFFADEATSSFIVKREGKQVIAEVHGRNEVANTSETDNVGAEIRNVIVATGAKLGFSGFQWKKLVNGLIRIEK